jgi:hypothetical protein
MTPAYCDLAEFGLPFVTHGDSMFAELLRDIEERPRPFPSFPGMELKTAAILLNQTGKAIVALSYVWRYTSAGGSTRATRYSNLGSSVQLDVLCGRAEVFPDLTSFILSGSKRLITEQGMFGDNLNVLPPAVGVRDGGYVGVGGGGPRREPDDSITAMELVLDAAILEDGLCVGPDESGLFERVAAGVVRQRITAREIVTALREGASEGAVFDLLLPLARHHDADRAMKLPLLTMFANMAIHRLVNTPSAELVPWFEGMANSPPLPLHRADQTGLDGSRGQ